ncbi:MAG: metalloendopeptidase, partial [Proteobacteria bacterium]|nr:metalloendopeptidase [Pseudomonadota bacterium]
MRLTVIPIVLAPFAVALMASQGNAQSDIADQQRRLLEARSASAAAADRAAKLEAAADTERDQAARALAEERALAAKVQQAQADIAAATARIALVDRLLSDQQQKLAVQQGP